MSIIYEDQTKVLVLWQRPWLNVSTSKPRHFILVSSAQKYTTTY